MKNGNSSNATHFFLIGQIQNYFERITFCLNYAKTYLIVICMYKTANDEKQKRKCLCVDQYLIAFQRCLIKSEKENHGYMSRVHCKNVDFDQRTQTSKEYFRICIMELSRLELSKNINKCQKSGTGTSQLEIF